MGSQPRARPTSRALARAGCWSQASRAPAIQERTLFLNTNQTTTSMSIKVVYDATSGQTWVVRLVHRGEHYGLNDQLVHDEREPLVEFFDPRQPHTDLGQFVSRYFVGTLLEGSGGLDLMGHEPTWKISSSAMLMVRDWLRKNTEVGTP